MKKLLALMIFVAGGCSAQNTATISGTIESLADGTKIELHNYGTYERERPLGEAVAQDGKFAFTVELDQPRMFLIEAGPQNGNYTLIAAPGEKITLSGRSFRGVDLAGSEWTPRFRELTEKAWDEYSAMEDELDEAQRAAEYEKQLKRLEQIIADNSDTFFGPLLIYQFSGNLIPSEEMYAALSDEAKNSFHGRALRAYLDTLFKGKSAPAFTAKDRDGREYTLAGLLEGNRYLIIDFWASWCGPCRRGIPEMKEFAEKYAGEGLAIVNISIDTDREAWLKALDEEQMPWTNLHDDGTVKEAYEVGSIPSVFLIDANGTVLFERLYGDKIGRELKALFGY